MSFKLDLSISSELESEINNEVRAFSFRAFRNIVFATPVDEGRARGNWQVSISSPINKSNSNKDKTGAATVSSGASAIDSAKSVKYPTIWITNNLPYIQRLNEGHSERAPIMFVETAIKRAVK